MLELYFHFIVVQISAAPDSEGEEQWGDAAVHWQRERPRGDREAAGGGESFGGQGFSIQYQMLPTTSRYVTDVAGCFSCVFIIVDVFVCGLGFSCIV